ncbi:DUF523 domain-containing protein [Algicola sagamiensis]|uniref:DUF523 domain-containing protein n=1 Tax=Algicola sagamiensis TaxID=163869 RepID=UPI0003804E22|nr:DUF523 domain-containing protein [Algicola sagamiensis]
MKKVFVSACLLGQPVRYDGQAKPSHHPALIRWLSENRVITLCPEVSGGLPIPRPQAERQPDQRVITIQHLDVTAEFERGAEAALQLCFKHNIRIAVLKENSPSCGSHHIYSGQFNGETIPGEGLTTQRLRQSGVLVFSENEWDKAQIALSKLDR